MSREGEVQVLPYVLLLHAFCLVDPGLCTPSSDPTKFVITLQPYLKSQVIYIANLLKILLSFVKERFC